ncbi:hypothetical protein ACFL2Q_06475 [Thermodesulfobacteriota bacterium]
MKIGIVFHKNPFAPPAGIDLVRLRALAGGLIKAGIQAEVISPVEKAGMIDDTIPVKPIEVLNGRSSYDLVKTSYHFSIELIGNYQGPVVSRIVRVVDHELPERDEPFRQRLMDCQGIIRQRSSALVLNNRENEARWRNLYGPEPRLVLVPNGCPAIIPASGGNPYGRDEVPILFLGSVAAPRMVRILNEAADGLRDRARIHLVGVNKARLYGGDEDCLLNDLIVDHGEMPEYASWDYIRHARIGIALATGPHPFDNDVTKIFNYLRGGLPCLSEEPILNNELIHRTGHGVTFTHDCVDDLVRKALRLLDNPFTDHRRSVMDFMVQEHSWETRVQTYVKLFHDLLGGEHQL